MRVPLGTVTSRPSMVNVARLGSFSTSSRMGEPGSLDRALVAQAVLLVLLSEARHRPLDDPAGGVAEAAEAAAAGQALLDPVEECQIGGAAVAREHPLVGPHGPVPADPAGGALAARLVGVELHQAVGHLHNAAAVVGDDDAAR